MAPLIAAFEAFAGGPEMDGRAFLKCLMEVDVVGVSVTTTDVDLIFAKYKPAGKRKMGLIDFRRALTAIAVKLKMDDPAVLESRIALAGGPSYNNGTTRLAKGAGPQNFNDPALFTGTAVAGGPTNLGGTGGGYSQLSGLISRDHVQDDALNRRKLPSQMKGSDPQASSGPRPFTPPGRQHPSCTSTASGFIVELTPPPPLPMTPQEEVRRPGSSYAPAGATLLGSSSLGPRASTPGRSKLSQTSKTSKASTSTHSNRLGAPVRAASASGSRSASDSEDHGRAAAKPRAKSKAGVRGPERFFYDKSTHTGVHRTPGGGPTTVDKGHTQVSDLSEITRSGLGPKLAR